MADIAPTPTAQPTPKVGQYDSLVNQIMSVYPALKPLNLTVTQGKGPGYSETYSPDDDENPVKGRWNVQLRQKSKDFMATPSTAAQMIASEGLHGLAQTDKTYQQFHKEFKKSFTPDQLKMAKEAYAREKEEFKGGVGSFDSWLERSRVEAYVRGGLFPDINPEWRRAGTYTPEQIQLLGKIHNYLTTPPASK